MTIRTFSGTHDFDPTVLADTDADEQGNADEIIDNIENGRCPRCTEPLPTPPEYPAGSRITACRSIPICGKCGSDEAYQAIDAARGIGWGTSSAGAWPLDPKDIDERCARFTRETKPAILAVEEGRLITEDGSSRVINPRNTGGWAQYGTFEESRTDD